MDAYSLIFVIMKNTQKDKNLYLLAESGPSCQPRYLPIYRRYLPIYAPWVPKDVCRGSQDILLTRQKWQPMTTRASDALKCLWYGVKSRRPTEDVFMSRGAG